MRIGNGVSPAVAPLGVCFLLPLRWECPFYGPIRGGSIPAKISSEREGEREEEDVHPLREFWRETTRPKDNRRRLHSPRGRYKARWTSEACQPQQQRGLVAAALASEAQQVNIIAQARSLPLSLPLPPFPKATIPGGGGGLRGRRQSISSVCRMAKRRWREGRPRG